MAFASVGRVSAFGVACAILLATICGPGRAQTAPRPAVATPTEGPGQTGPELKIDRDLAYSRDSGKALSLDLYRMVPNTTKAPVVVWIHDDGALGGKSASPAVGLIRAGGVAVASIDYRS